ncbi:MAG TPA: PQQ-dependent sugar dehydrogenase [Pyrinomonadaceae bacterium]|nr:PQQ-dependent sugar dehydrogenase [Pyrinomonadaceae bacterium]
MTSTRKKSQLAVVMTGLLLVASTACAQNAREAAKTPAQTNAASPAATPPCAPLETRRANAPGQRPAFPGQTRACGVKSDVAFEVTVLAKGLDRPWAVEPLPNGDLLVTEKIGRMRIVSAKGEVGQPIGGLLPVGAGGVSAASGQGGLPPITARGQGGLLDVVLSPNFAQDRTVYWSFSEQRQGGSGTSVAVGVLTEDRRNLEQVRVIFRAMPTYDNGLHFGSRLAFGPDGKLYITLGERFDRTTTRPQAQHLNSHLGKIIRLNPDGSVPTDNPFAGQSGAMPEVWTLGHRNVQSAAFDEGGRLWAVEHGAQGGDELNLIEKGKNYGWPLITYGEEYSGEPVPGATTAREGLEQPVYYWDPVIAPSGAQFYTGDAFPGWRGSLFVGALKEERLVRLVIKSDRVVGEEYLLADRGQRVRDVRQGPDGALYVVTDQPNGELWKITPKR